MVRNQTNNLTIPIFTALHKRFVMHMLRVYWVQNDAFKNTKCFYKCSIHSLIIKFCFYSFLCSSEQELRLRQLLPGLVGLCWRATRWAVLQARRHHLHPQQGKTGATAWKLPDLPQLSQPTWLRTEIIQHEVMFITLPSQTSAGKDEYAKTFS